jgi:NAD(P)-dependent dehydrogenase (short-subunit alcohol dehydrogenase family)
MERTLSPDRIELTFALNHLSYFILTQLLLERLKSSAPSRVINVSSAAHLLAWLKLEDLEMSRGYSGWMAYSHTKLMNIYFTKELARQLDGSGVTANALHPGYIKTRLALNNKGVYPRLFKLAQVFASSAEKGAATPVFLASSPAAAKFSGSYFVNRRVTRSSRTSNDPGIAQKLWERSLQYIQ